MEQKIKKCWQQATFSTENPLTPTGTMQRNTALHSLARRYRHFSRLALILAVTFPFLLTHLLHNQSSAPMHLTIVTIATGSLYLLTASIMDRWLYNGISNIDLSQLTVACACERALYYRKKHLQFILVLVPFAAVFIALLAYLLSSNTYALWGMLCGGIAGLCIGAYKLHQFMSEYRSIINP